MLLVLPAIADAASGDDSTQNEVGTWAINYYDPPVGPGYPDGWQLTNLGASIPFANNFWNVLHYWGNCSVRVNYQDDGALEKHLKDNQFYGGSDQSYFDSVDVGLFAGHGPHSPVNNPQYGWLAFRTYNSDHALVPTEVRWGNWDLDWVLINSCNFLNFYGWSSTLLWLQQMFAGVHEILGYATDMQMIDAQGTELANYLVGGNGYPVCSFWDAWKLAADQWQPSGKKVRILYSDANNLYEYFPGFGWHGAEPSPYPGSLVYRVDHPIP